MQGTSGIFLVSNAQVCSYVPYLSGFKVSLHRGEGDLCSHVRSSVIVEFLHSVDRMLSALPGRR